MSKTRSEAKSDETGLDLAVALFVLAWAVTGWISLATGRSLFDKNLYGRLDPGPGLMPVIVLSVLTVGGLAIAARPVIALVAGKARLHPRLVVPWRPLVFFVSVALFAPVMNLIGYLPTTLVFVFVWALALDPNLRLRPAITVSWAAVAALLTTLVVYVGFDWVIGAQLP